MLKKGFILSFAVFLAIFICICGFPIPGSNTVRFSLASEIKVLKKAGEYDTPGEARSVNIVGKYVYVGEGESGLLIIDISDPSKPEVPWPIGITKIPGRPQPPEDHHNVSLFLLMLFLHPYRAYSSPASSVCL